MRNLPKLYRLRQRGTILSLSAFKDFAYVSLDGVSQGFLLNTYNDASVHSTTLFDCPLNSTLHVLVENQGRLAYDTENDFKVGCYGSAALPIAIVCAF